MNTKHELLDFIRHFESAIPPDQLDSFRVLVEAGEGAVALEILIDQIGDFEVRVERTVALRMEAMAKDLDLLNSNRWKWFAREYLAGDPSDTSATKPPP